MINNFCEINNFSQLNHNFKIIVFDWDGTAVNTRNDDISELIAVLEKLLIKNIFIVVVTGTNFVNIDRQFSSYIKGIHKQNLYICTNRGSEVYGFNQKSEAILLYQVNISEEENNILNQIAEKTKSDIIASCKNEIALNIIYDRLNRKKLDLIPEWENPLKSEISELITQTENKLKNNGFKKGIKGAFELMKKNAEIFKLNNPRITSDVKHLEIGISDKSDSIKWILENIAKPNKIIDENIIILGDEFGEIAGFNGSDYKMVLNNHKKIIYYSVGIEPQGVPHMVNFIGGGAACFLEIMKFLNVS